MKSTLTLLAAMLLAPLTSLPAAGTDTNLFPFVLPADDITEGVTDLSFLNTKPATELVSVRDGHFFAGGQRIRF